VQSQLHFHRNENLPAAPLRKGFHDSQTKSRRIGKNTSWAGVDRRSLACFKSAPVVSRDLLLPTPLSLLPKHRDQFLPEQKIASSAHEDSCWFSSTQEETKFDGEKEEESVRGSRPVDQWWDEPILSVSSNIVLGSQTWWNGQSRAHPQKPQIACLRWELEVVAKSNIVAQVSSLCARLLPL